MNRIFLFAATIAALAVPASAARKDNQEKQLKCDDSRDSDRHHYCEMKEFPLAAAPRLELDSRPNGGVSVKGWSRNDVLVRAQIRTTADSDAEARNLAGQVQVLTSAGLVRAEGPKQERRQNWSVSFEVFVPFKTSVKARSVNGGVRVSDLEGEIEADCVNGGVTLARLAGNVHGRTTNGGVKVELDGNAWQGQGLDVETTNGGIKISVPESYSAQVEASTLNGGVNSEFPVTVNGRIDRRNMRFNLGSGGAPIRAKTTNGGVSIQRMN